MKISNFIQLYVQIRDFHSSFDFIIHIEPEMSRRKETRKPTMIIVLFSKECSGGGGGNVILLVFEKKVW